MNLPGLNELEAAALVVYRHMAPTPQFTWPLLSGRLGAEVWLKHENHTPLGAFKVRGGLVYCDWLRREHPEVEHVVAATRGNHGQSIAFAAGLAGMKTTIVVPFGNSREKNAAMRGLGAELIEAGDDFQAALEEARRLAAERGWWLVPSFDERLIAGVGTYALEMLRAVPELEVVYVPVGMGSGIAGMLAAKAALGRQVEVVGVGSAHAPATARSFAGGEVVSAPVTTWLADGLACRTPHPDAVALMRAGVSRMVEVTDDEVAEAMRVLYADTHNLAEGAGAAGVAALLKERETLGGRRVGTVLCGANVDREVFARVLAGGSMAA